MKNYYELLDIPTDAQVEDVKRAFRQLIARYHPDKVQHLGREFQEMAAVRAAELTEAYQVLSNLARRAEYDKVLAAGAADDSLADTAGAERPAHAAHANAFGPSQRTRFDTAQARPEPAPNPAPEPARTPDVDRDREPERPVGALFREERASRDAFVRRAILDRFRKAFSGVAGAGYNESRVRGFDVAWLPNVKRSARGVRPRLVGKLVGRVDAAAVADAWKYAANWNVPAEDEICVILMGTAIAPPRELAAAIATERQRPTRGAKVTLIPVNMNVWDAFIPTDAPPIAKDLLARLREMN